MRKLFSRIFGRDYDQAARKRQTDRVEPELPSEALYDTTPKVDDPRQEVSAVAVHGDLEIIGYLEGADRNNPDLVKSHMYALDRDYALWPMCEYGWNRSDGQRFSILRGHHSSQGTCAVCLARVVQHAKPVLEAKGHKTRWL